MAYDKVVDSTQLDAGLKSIADAIRAKGKTSASLTFPDGFSSAVTAIKTGADIGQFSKIEVSEWTPAYNTKKYISPTIADAKYCLISDKSVTDRQTNSTIALAMFNFEFFSTYKTIVELIVNQSGGVENSENYYGKENYVNVIESKSNFIGGRTYDVIILS